MKKIIALLLVVLMAISAIACAAPAAEPAAAAPAAEAAPAAAAEPAAAPAEEAAPVEEGKVFNIYAWNEEFKGFFEKYYTVPEGVTVNWIITPSADGAYQDKLDAALIGQADAADDDKVDMFLAEADYILK